MASKKKRLDDLLMRIQSGDINPGRESSYRVVTPGSKPSTPTRTTPSTSTKPTNPQQPAKTDFGVPSASTKTDTSSTSYSPDYLEHLRRQRREAWGEYNKSNQQDNVDSYRSFIGATGASKGQSDKTTQLKKRVEDLDRRIAEEKEKQKKSRDSQEDKYQHLDMYNTPEQKVDYEASLKELEKKKAELRKKRVEATDKLIGYTSGDNSASDHAAAESIQDHVDFLDAELKAVNSQIYAIKTGKWNEENLQKFAGAASKSDFTSNSKADPEVANNTYRYINNIGNQRELVKKFAIKEEVRDLKKYETMSKAEIATYNYLYKTEGMAVAQEYLDYISYDLDYRKNQDLSIAAADYADKHPVKASAASVATNLASGAGLVDVAGQNAVLAINQAFGGEFTPINYYSDSMAAATVTQAIRGQVAQNLTDNYGTIQLDETEHPYMAKFLNGKGYGDVYQLGMSMADSSATAMLGGITGIGAAGAVLLGGSAGTQGMLDALSRGATDSQALAMGIFNGTFEALFEYASLDKLLHSDPTKLLKNFFTQGFIEGSEELNTTLFNTMVDAIIMAQNSEFNQMVKAYMNDEGLSKAEAEHKAWQDIGRGMMWDYLGGMATGGIMATGHTVSANVRAAMNLSRLEQALGQMVKGATGKSASTSHIGEMEKGKAAAEGSEAHKLALQVEKALKETGTVSTKLLGKLTRANQMEVEELLQKADAATAAEVKAEIQATGNLSTGTMAKLRAAVNTSTAASTEVQQAEAQAQQVKAANPKATVLDAAATKFVEQGMSVKKAQEKADIVHRLVAGEAVTDAEINRLGPTNPKSRALFTELTGVQFPEGKLSIEVLRSLYRSASDMDQQARDSMNPEAAQETLDFENMTDEEVQARAQEVRGTANADNDAKAADIMAQAMGSVGPDGKALLSFKEFSEWMQEQAPGMPADQVAKMYQQYLQDNATVEYRDGKRVSHQEWMEMVRNAPGGDQLTDDEAEALWQGALDSQRGQYRYSLSDMEGDLQSQKQRQAQMIEAAEQARRSENEATAQWMKQVLSHVGVTDVVVEYGTMSEKENAYIQNGVIHFNGDTMTGANAMIWTVGHELVHHGEKKTGSKGTIVDDIIQAFDKLNQAGLLDGITQEWMDDVDARVDTLIETYKKHAEAQLKANPKDEQARKALATLDDSEKAAKYVREELAADLMRQAFTDDGILLRLAGEKPSLILRAQAAMQRMLAKLSSDDTVKAVIEARDELTAMEKRFEDALTKSNEEHFDQTKRYSIDSMAEALGLTYEKSETPIKWTEEVDGKTIEHETTTVFRDKDGKVVDQVSLEMVQQSPLGAVIKSAVGKYITDKQAEQQYKFFKDLFNMSFKVGDIDLVWAVSSSIGFQPLQAGPRDLSKVNQRNTFAGLTNNSDPQYSTTVDFTTICLKTQAVIDAMSGTMKELGRGLTEEEITDIVYKNTHEAGEPVPCPVCYVFSRWVGLGGLLDTMNTLQLRYANADESVIRRDLDTLEEQIREVMVRRGIESKTDDDGDIKINTDGRNALYKEMSKRRNLLESKLNLEKLQNQAELSKDEKKKQKRMKKALDKAEESYHITDEERAELEQLKHDMYILDNWTWLHDIRLSDNYKPVPPDILFDINAGKTFAEEYPESWKFRTSRGPAMGKAATPYADEHLGQIVRGLGVSDVKAADLGNPAKNNVLKSENGELSKAAQNDLDRSRERMRAQNLLNGQRYQSTSDFRFEYALDYLMSFVEMQAVGGKVQLYTKVAESVPMFASVNAEVNCSLMPKGNGYVEVAEGTPNAIQLDGKWYTLDCSPVTGINAEDAFAMSAKYNNVQPIMVGINNTHLRLCLADNRITFIIPYHASGASEGRYLSLMQTVGEEVESRTDYSDYQGDHKNKRATPEQVKARELRSKILTGKVGMLSESDKAILRGNARLHELYKRFYGKDLDGNSSPLDPRYLSPDLRAKGDVYRSDEFEGISFPEKKGEVEIPIMPFEYWDRTSTIDDADAQGQAFIEYCESLGLHPRFSGWDAKGKYHADMDFTKEPGYWKMLIDRAMYNNDGTYHEQKTIDVTNFSADYLFRDKMAPQVVQPSAVNDPNKTKAIVAKSVADIQARSEEGPRRYSLEPVDDVMPSGTKWTRSKTTAEAMQIFPNMWNVTAEESEVRNPTQITSTVKSYRKIYDALKAEGFSGDILDASSGLGYGTKAGIEEYGFKVDDIEPYPDAGYEPKFKDYSSLNKKYDAIISNAVLNVLPQDQRDALAVKMGQLLNVGGRLFVNVRGKDVDSLAKTGKNIQLGEREWIETVRGSYQKGFTKPELVAYLKDALGPNFTVEPTTAFGAVSAVVTKIAESETQENDKKFSLNEEEKGALLRYKSSDSYKVNAALRGEHAWTEELKSLRDSLDSAIPKLPVYSGRAFRVLEFDSFGDGAEKLKDYADRFTEGQALVENGYVSASKKSNADRVANSKNKAYIILNTTSAHEMEGYGINTEDELIFARGTRFVVDRKATLPDGSLAMEWSEVTEDNSGQATEGADEGTPGGRRLSMAETSGTSGTVYTDSAQNDRRGVLDDTQGSVRGGDTGGQVTDTRYSLADKQLDKQYEEALKKGDWNAQDKLVEKAARRAGYDSPLLYHGTDAFGFTEFRQGPGDYVFATSSKELAGSYSAGKGPKALTSSARGDGMYALYGKLGKSLTVDAKGGKWHDLPVPKELSSLLSMERTDTDNIAWAAKKAGYDSVVIKSVRDPGGRTNFTGAGDVYIFMDKTQVKSADMETKDNNGKTIPLSERFDPNKPDLRWSLEDSEGRQLSQQQRDYFRNSKVRDEMGRLLRVYHGSDSFGFTEFNPEASDDGISLFFTSEPLIAKTYVGNPQATPQEITKDTDLEQYKPSEVPIESAKDAVEVLNSSFGHAVQPEPIKGGKALQERATSSAQSFVDELENLLDGLGEGLNGESLVVRTREMLDSAKKQLERMGKDGSGENNLRTAFYRVENGFNYLSMLYDNARTNGDAYARLIKEAGSMEAADGILDMLSDTESVMRSASAWLEAMSAYSNSTEDLYLTFAFTEDGVKPKIIGEENLIWFAEDVNADRQSSIYSTYLNLENPFVLDCYEYNWDDLGAEGFEDQLKELGIDDPWEGYTTRSIAEWAKEKGYDGVILRDLYDHGGRLSDKSDAVYEQAQRPADIYIAFNAEQVKSTGNTEPTKSKDIRYSLTDTGLSFADQVELAAKNKLNEFLVSRTAPSEGYQPSALYVTKEPNSLMQELGFGNYALVTTQKHIHQMIDQREATDKTPFNPHNHQLTTEMVGEMPELLDRPAAVILPKGHPGTAVFVTTAVDYAGNPVIIPVKANGTGITYNGVDGPAHIVTSMYGRENFGAWFSKAVENGELAWFDKKRIDPIMTRSGYHRSGLLSAADSGTILQEVEPIVKDPGERKYSLTPEFEQWYRSMFDNPADADASIEKAKRYSELMQRYGAMEPTNTATRETPVPQKTTPKKKVIETVRTVMGAEATPAKRVPTIVDAVADGKLTQVPMENDVFSRRATGILKREGWNKTLRDWTAEVRSGKASPSLVAMGAVLLNNAGNSNATGEEYLDILSDYTELMSRSGKALQMGRLINDLSPEGKLYMAEKTVKKINEQLRNRKGAKAKAAEDAALADITEVRDTALQTIQDIFKALSEDKKQTDHGVPVEEWMQEVGKKLAQQISNGMADKTPTVKPITRIVQEDLLKFAESYALPKGKSLGEQRRASDRLADFYANRDGYVEAWKAAKTELQERYKDNPEALESLEELLNGTLDYNGTGSDAVMLSAVAEFALEGDTKIRDIVMRSKLGDTKALEARVFNALNSKVKATGADAESLKLAVSRYVANAMETTDTDKALANRIKGSMHDIGVKMSNIIKQGDSSKEAVAKRIADMLIKQYGVSNEGAAEASRIVVDKFTEMTKAAAEQRLTSMFKERPTRAERSLLMRFDELVNMGAFTSDKFSGLAAEKIFGFNVQIDTKLIDKYRAATTDNARDAVMEEITADIASKIPATKMEKFTALRYLNMLGNLKTQVRNVFGNFMYQPARIIKDEIGAAIETIAQKGLGMNIERTKAFGRDAETFKAGFDDFKSVRDLIMGGGKYNDNARFSQAIEAKRRIFKSALLEGYRRATDTAMDVGDAVFSQAAYADALAGYIKANGATWSTASEALKDKARTYAIRQAAEATYRDNNAFSQAISQMRFRNADTWAKRAINTVGEGVMPFRKTPANILVRSVEYSPAGILLSAVNGVRAAHGGEVTASQVIDQLAKGLTGSGLMMLGYMAASAGILRGGEDDDDKKAEFDEMQGHQPYSIEVGGHSYTLDWLAPEAVPLFLGAQAYQATKGGDLSVGDMLVVMSSISDPLLEMSMLQGLNDSLQNASSYGDDSALVRFAGNALWSYATQGLSSTLLGQAVRTFGNNRNIRMTTYVDKNSEVPQGMQSALGKFLAKVPFLDYNQIPYIDAWGRMETNADNEFMNGLIQFASPAYIDKVDSSSMEGELERLYGVTKDSGVLPSRAPKYFTNDGQRIDLTAQQYVEFASDVGSTKYNTLTALTGSKLYKSLTEEQRAAAVSSVYDYATQTGKNKLVGYKMDNWIVEAQASGNPEVYIAVKAATSKIEGWKDKDGKSIANSQGLQVMDAIYKMPGLTETQRKSLFEAMVGKTIRSYSASKVEKELKKLAKKAVK